MNDDNVVDVDGREVSVRSQRMEGLKTWGWISYLLHLVVAVGAVVPGAQPSVMLLLAALVIDLVKRGDAQGTWQQSHFSWRIRSVIWAAIWYVLTIWGFFLGLLLFNPLWVVVSVWFLYRIVRGMIAMNKNQAIHV